MPYYSADAAMISFFSVLAFWFIAWLVMRWLYYNTALRASIKQRYYISLYELYKLEEDLKRRNISFKELDAMYERVAATNKTEIDNIDELYAKPANKTAARS